MKHNAVTKVLVDVVFNLPHWLVRCLNTGTVCNVSKHLLYIVPFVCSLESSLRDLPGVENVITRQLLGSSDHFLSTDNTDVVRGLQVFRSSVRVSEQRQKWEEKWTGVLARERISWVFIQLVLCVCAYCLLANNPQLKIIRSDERWG